MLAFDHYRDKETGETPVADKSKIKDSRELKSLANSINYERRHY